MIRPVARTTYVPHIDGLRAVAVLSVIVYHLKNAWLPGGFSGVDIFFVISGFVVSASLAEFRNSTPLAFFPYFYARRILRIVPALVVCLVVTHVAAMLFIPWAWLSHTSQQTGIFAFFGLSNFVLATTGNDYFSPRAEFNPFTHTWSLGVEEQFYLIFPPLFAAWIAGGRARRWSTLLFAAGLVASLAWAAWLARTERNLAFYMLYTRFWELAAGVLLYQAFVWLGHEFSERDRPMTWWSHGVSILSVALIGIGFARSHPWTFPYPGALLPVVGTLGLLGALHGRRGEGPVKYLLEHPVVVFIGQISYSLYLWHWPVFVVFRWTAGLEATSAKIAAVALTFMLAIASYYAIERPPRRAGFVRRAPRLVIIAAGIVVVGSSALVAQAITQKTPDWSLTSVGRNMSEWYPGRLDGVGKRNCVLRARGETVGGGHLSIWSGVGCSRPPSSPQRLFVIGDSHAEAYSTMLQLFAMDTGGEVYKYGNGGCPFLSLQLHREAGACPGYTQASVADMLRRMRSGDILFLPSLRLNRFADQNTARNEQAERRAMLNRSAEQMRARAVDEAVAVLRPFAERGIHIVLEAPKPIFRVPPFRCVDWFNAGNPICAPGLEMQRADLLRYRQPVMDAFAQIVERTKGVTIWDPFPLLCPDPICEAVVDGHPLFYDGDHLSGYGNRVLAPHFETWMKRFADTTALANTE